jgi:hypothetical protein
VALPLAGAGAAWAQTSPPSGIVLDPFRNGRAPATATDAADPPAQASDQNQEKDAPAAEESAPAAASETPKAAPAAEAATSPPAAAGTCQSDSECPASRFCDAGRCKRNIYFPFLRFHGREEHRTTTLIGPYLRIADLNGSTQSLLPLFWHLRDRASGATTTFGFPLFLWHRGPGREGGIIGLAYGYHDQKGWAGGLFPFLFLSNRNNRSYQVVLPFLFHFNDRTRERDTLVFGPFYRQRTPNGWHAGLVPLVFAGRHDDVRYAAVPPLYVFRGDRHGSTHVFGPIYGSKRDDGYAFGLAPLFHFGKRGDARTQWFIPPLYLHTDDASDGRSYTQVGPLFFARSPRGHTSGLFPLIWVGNRGPRRFQFVLPLVGHLSDSARGTDRLWAGPYVRLHDTPKKSTTHLFFPLFAKHDSPNYHVFVQFPFVWRVVNGDQRTTVVFPFYVGQHSPDRSIDVGFPLVWRVRKPESTTTVVGPIYWRKGGGHFDGGLAPLFGFGSRGPGKRYAWIAPLIFGHSADAQAGRSKTVASLFFWSRKPGGWTSGFIPLVFAWRHEHTVTALAPFIYHRSDDALGTRVTVVGPVFSEREPHLRRFGLAPLFFYGSRDNGTWQATLIPLFHIAHKSDGYRVITLLGGWSTSAKGGLRGFIGPAYFRKSSEGYSAALFPLFFRRVNHVRGTRLTLFIPLFLRHTTPDSSLLGVTPLFWQKRTVDTTTTLGLPLFFDRNNAFESRTTGVIPLFIRHHSAADQSTSWVVPPALLYFKRQPQGHNVVFFPLLWRFKPEPENSTTVLFPLAWDFVRPGSRTQVVAPFYLYLRRETARTLVVLNTYYSHGRGPFADRYTFDFFPLVYVSRPSTGDIKWRFLEGLVGYSRIGRTRKLRLFWVIDIPLASTTPSPTTFFDATPPSGRLSLD